MIYVYTDHLASVKNETDLLTLLNKYYATDCTSLYTLECYLYDAGIKAHCVNSSMRQLLSHDWGNIGRLVGQQSSSLYDAEMRIKPFFDYFVNKKKKIPWNDYFGLKFMAFYTYAHRIESKLNEV